MKDAVAEIGGMRIQAFVSSVMGEGIKGITGLEKV